MTDRRVALVTGTSSGIGLHTALGLAAAGLQVVATMRDPARGDRLRESASQAGLDLDVRTLDVVDRDRAERCLAAVEADYGCLDVLVNNAGRGHVATLEQLSATDLQDQLDLNYLGPALLTRAVLPGMRRRGHGRIVTISSVGGAVGQPFADAYCGAKFAIEGLMQSLAPVVARFGIDVCVVEPAAVASDFVTSVGGAAARTAAGEPAGDDREDEAYADLLDAYLARSQSSFASAQTAADAAAVVVEAATTGTPKFRWQTSPAAAAFAGLSLADLDGSAVLDQTATWLA